MEKYTMKYESQFRYQGHEYILYAHYDQTSGYIIVTGCWSKAHEPFCQPTLDGTTRFVMQKSLHISRLMHGYEI